MSNIVIRVENLYKQYQLGTVGYGTIRHDLEAWFARLRGKEDPNAQISNKKHKDLNETFFALKDINFEVERGQAVGIIGRNGAGKSTLLKVLSRTTAPTQGQIKIKGKIASLLEVGTGFHPELTGRENIFLNGAILGMTKKEISKKFDEIVAFSGIEKFIDTPVKRYSSGMYVRLAFAVAANLDSDILILDEVLAVGDAEFQKKCLGKMDDVAKNQGRTVLFVSHNMAAIKSLCKKGILLSKGALVNSGSANEIIEQYFKLMNANLSETFSQIVDVLTIPRNHNEASELIFDKLYFDKPLYLSNDSCEIKIQLKSNQKKRYLDLVFGLHIQDKYNNCVYHLSNVFVNKDVEHKEENQYVFSLPRLNLPTGRYTIGLYLKANKETQDSLENAGFFDVKGNSYIYNGIEILNQGFVLPEFKFNII